MALQRNDPVARVRRTTVRALGADAVVGLLVFALIGHVIGLIVFLVGLIATGGYWYNFRQVFKNRGYL